MPVYKPKRILDFGKWIRIIKYNGEALTVRRQSFSVIMNDITNQSAQEILEYLRDISQYTSESQVEGWKCEEEKEEIIEHI